VDADAHRRRRPRSRSAAQPGGDGRGDRRPVHHDDGPAVDGGGKKQWQVSAAPTPRPPSSASRLDRHAAYPTPSSVPAAPKRLPPDPHGDDGDRRRPCGPRRAPAEVAPDGEEQPRPGAVRPRNRRPPAPRGHRPRPGRPAAPQRRPAAPSREAARDRRRLYLVAGLIGALAVARASSSPSSRPASSGATPEKTQPAPSPNCSSAPDAELKTLAAALQHVKPGMRIRVRGPLRETLHATHRSVTDKLAASRSRRGPHQAVLWHRPKGTRPTCRSSSSKTPRSCS